MRTKGPRSRGLGPGARPARVLEVACVLCARCPVRSRGARCPGRRGVAIKNESVLRGARDRPRRLCDAQGRALRSNESA